MTAANSRCSTANSRPAFWRSRIGRRLLIAILAFSSLVTLGITVSDLYLDYVSGVSAIRERLRQIEVSYAESLGESLWNLDKRQIVLQLRGIADLPDIRTVELRETTPDSPVRFAVTAAGNPPGPGEDRDIAVWCNCDGTYRDIGVLHVQTTHANLYRDIMRRALVILAGQTLKTFLVATFILFIVHQLVTRRLLELAGAIVGFTPGTTAPLALCRRQSEADEFDDLVDSFNTMGQRLERRDAELNAANARMEAILDNMPGTVFRMRYPAVGPKKLIMLDGGGLHGRPDQSSKLVALSAEQFMQRFHPDDHHMLYHDVPIRLRMHGTAEFVMRRIDPDGTWRWARTWERVVESHGDEMITEGITLDVTEEMDAKLALEASNLRYSDLVHALPVGVFEYERGKGCVYASELWSKITGLRTEQLQGDGWTTAIHPEDLPRVIAQWRQDEEASAPSHNEFRLRHLDGNLCWVLSRALPRLDEDGRLLGYIGSITDISDRKAYEASLERLNRVLRIVAVGNETLMQQSDKLSVFSVVCRVLAEMGGYRLAWIGLAEADDRKSVRPVAAAGPDTDYLNGIDVRWDESPRGTGPSGKAIRTRQRQIVNDIATDACMTPWRDEALRRGLHSAIALPLKTENTVVGCLNLYAAETNAFPDEEGHALQDFAHNIAFAVLAMRERRRREEAERHLQQAQKMEALGLLAGSVAHDFNNLLGAILGFAGFIAEDSPDSVPAGHYARRILTAGKRGRALIGQILSFSRQLDVKHELFVVADLLAETLALLTASLPNTTRVTIDADADLPAVFGDRNLLGQALFNLCMNANDAMGNTPGTLTIQARATDPARADLHRLADDATTTDAGGTVAVWQDEDGALHAVLGAVDLSRPCVSLAVVDGGCGMDRAVLEKIFVPFFSTKRQDLGTGLGLPAVLRTITAHRGAILVTTRPRRGSTFEMIFPCGDGSNAMVASEPSDTPRQAKITGRILLVDDNPDFGDMLLAALERRGFDVAPCSDPREALAGIEEFPDAWDVMITDQTMPHMSGLELIRSAKSIQPALTCILCTGYAEDALDDATLAEAGATTLLHKPVDMDDLVERLTRLLPRPLAH